MSLRAELIEEAERELAANRAEHEAETCPLWREVLAAWIAINTEWLAELRAPVRPLPFRLPNGLPAPRLVREVGR